MNKLNKGQIIFLSIIALVLAYFLAGVLIFALNDAIKMLPKFWKPNFTYLAIIKGYPKIYPAIGLSLLISFLVVFLLPFIPKKEKLYGNAKFANSADIRKMGLFPKKAKNGKIDTNGIIIGMYNNQLLRFGGQQFVALGAPTRSGKGVGIVIPNLLDYPNSCVVQDIKQECFEYTSKYRHDILKQEIYLFNPFGFQTHRYNPLYYIDMKGNNTDAELNDFANILYPLKNDGSVTDYFNGKAKDLFIGLCYLMNDLLGTRKGIAFLQSYNLECSFSLYGILKLSEGLNFELENKDGEKMIVSNFADTYKVLLGMENMVSPKAKERIDAFFEIKSDNERSSAMGSFISPLAIFRADNMRLATSANDFDFRDLRRKKMTIYIGITPDKLTSAKPILNIFWQQLILVNVQQGLPQSNKNLKHPCLLLMDEFTASGYLATYSSAISFIAGYDLRSLIIYQADSQLTNNKPEGYGQAEANTLLKNHACRIYYAMKDDDAERLSKALGTKTVKQRSRNLGGSGGSESETSRALMLPKEIEEMPFDTEIIKIEGKLPIKCKKAFYFSNRYFMNKFKQVSHSLRTIDGKEYETDQYEKIVDKKTGEVKKQIKIKQKGKIPTRKQLETAIQNGETKVEIPMQSEQTLLDYLNADIDKRLQELSEDNFIDEILENINEDEEKIDEEEYNKFENNKPVGEKE